MLSRRSFLSLTAATVASAPLRVWPNAGHSDLIHRSIPSSGESIPSVGMGTWRTFNVGTDPVLIAERTEVLKEFIEMGGKVVDSSPMYGSSAEVLNRAMETLGVREQIFSASKVWTSDTEGTARQVKERETAWGIKRFDLMQVHNLREWESHLAALKRMQENKEIRYLGITTSHGRRHGDLAKIMKNHKLDFVQLTYNILDREVETELLPLARELGIAVMVNRPFQGGWLFDKFASNPLPPWSIEAGCKTWAEFFLKFILSHPAVSCVIPATTKVTHMAENMRAMRGPLPDQKMRQKMLEHLASL